MLPGVSVVSALRAHLRSDPSALDHAVLLLDTVTCQNPCSGHGRCDEVTRRCVCDRFWTENVFRRLGSDGQANCGECGVVVSGDRSLGMWGVTRAGDGGGASRCVCVY